MTFSKIRVFKDQIILIYQIEIENKVTDKKSYKIVANTVL